MKRIGYLHDVMENTNLENKSMLELGGGTGFLSRAIALRKRAKATIVDNNEEAHNLYQKHFSTPGVNYVVSDMFTHRQKYDFVFSDGLVEHFYPAERKNVILLHAKLMNDRGVGIIFVPKNSFFVKRFLSMKNEYEKKYSVKELEKELVLAGLRVIKSASDFHMVGVMFKK